MYFQFLLRAVNCNFGGKFKITVKLQCFTVFEIYVKADTFLILTNNSLHHTVES